MMLNWDKTKCSCEAVSTGGYRGEHDGPHMSESPWGTYSVEPWGQTRFRTTFDCGCCTEKSVVAEGVSWQAAYVAAKEHFAEMFKRRMIP